MTSPRYDDREQWEAAAIAAEEHEDDAAARGIFEKLGDTYQDSLQLSCEEQDFLVKILPQFFALEEGVTTDALRHGTDNKPH